MACLQDAFQMLKEMRARGVPATVDTFNTLMNGCIRRNDPAGVPRLFDQMVQAGQSDINVLPCVQDCCVHSFL